MIDCFWKKCCVCGGRYCECYRYLPIGSLAGKVMAEEYKKDLEEMGSGRELWALWKEKFKKYREEE